jgi:two-component system, cell cycle response regulator DivK
MTDLHHPLVLIVDDDSDTRELYRMVLESVGYRVEDAGHVRTATAAALALIPDVVVTDWLLPDGEGLEIGRALRANRRTRRIPIVAVTGMSLDQAAETNASLEGITAILRKPANPDDMLSAISIALTKAAERRLCDAATRTRRYADQVRRLAMSPAGSRAGIRVDPGVLLERVASRSDHSIVLVLADDSGHYVAASGATRELTGYDAAELAGLTVWDLTPSSQSVDGQGLWSQFIASGAQQGRYVLRRRDGRPVEAQYCALANIAPGWHVSALAELPAHPLTLRAF